MRIYTTGYGGAERMAERISAAEALLGLHQDGRRGPPPEDDPQEKEYVVMGLQLRTGGRGVSHVCLNFFGAPLDVVRKAKVGQSLEWVLSNLTL
jgi:hypothetical protein